MKAFTKVTFTILLLLLTSGFLFSQDMPDLKVRLGGTVQGMASYSQTGGVDTSQIGFGLRRVRLRAYTSYGKHFKGMIQMEVTNPKLLDARITYGLNENFNVRVGRFIGAGVRSGGLTSHTVIDIVERPLTAQRWGAATIGGDYRDYGLAVFGKIAGGLSYNVTIHNGDGARNIKATHKGAGKTLNSGFAFSGMLTFKPASVKGLEAGGYYGVGNKYFNDYNAYNAYVYYTPSQFEIKAEYIGWKNNTSEVSSAGYYVFGGYFFTPKIELLARYESFDPNADVDEDAQNLITVGARYFLFPTKKTAGKITAAYVVHGEQGTAVDNDVFYLMFQLVF
ncbi:MAG: porin [Chlorobi bacterium]|nr:porin [Chlorobiota bacterium]